MKDVRLIFFFFFCLDIDHMKVSEKMGGSMWSGIPEAYLDGR